MLESLFNKVPGLKDGYFCSFFVFKLFSNFELFVSDKIKSFLWEVPISGGSGLAFTFKTSLRWLPVS